MSTIKLSTFSSNSPEFNNTPKSNGRIQLAMALIVTLGDFFLGGTRNITFHDKSGQRTTREIGQRPMLTALVNKLVLYNSK